MAGISPITLLWSCVVVTMVPALLSLISVVMVRRVAAGVRAGALRPGAIRWFPFVRDYSLLIVFVLSAVVGVVAAPVLGALGGHAPGLQVAVMLVGVAGFLVFGWVTENLETVITPQSYRPDWRELAHKTLVYLTFALLMSLASFCGMQLGGGASWPGAWSWAFWGLFLGLVACLYLSESVVGLVEGEPIPMEGLPLQQELNAILGALGSKPREWKMKPLLRRGGGDPTLGEVEASLQKWATNYKALELDWIPSPMLHGMTTDHLTAAMAYLESQRIQRKPKRKPALRDRVVGITISHLLPWGLGAVVAMAVHVRTGFSPSLLFSLFVLLFVLLLSGKALRTSMQKTPEVMTEAWRAWAAQGPREDRSPLDFVMGDVMHDRLLKPGISPVVHLLVVSTCLHIVGFLDEHTTGRGREALAEVIDAAYDGGLRAAGWKG